VSCSVSSHSIPIHFLFISYSFSFIFLHFRSSFHSFLFSVCSLVLDSCVLILVPSGLLSYASVFIHVMCPSSRPFHMPFVHDCYVIASLFWTCTPSHFTLHVFLVVLFDSLFRQLYSLLVPPVWDQSECALFFQSLVPLLPFTWSLLLQAHSSFRGVAQVLSCCNSPMNKIFLCSPRSLDPRLSDLSARLSNSLNEVSVSYRMPGTPLP